jgi:hypothetical protein
MNNLIYDQLLSFGLLTASGIFPDVLNMGRPAGSNDSYPGEEFTDAERRTADVLFDAPVSSATVTVQGSKDGSTGWTDIGKNVFTVEQMKRGPCKTAISPNEFQYLRVSLVGGFGGQAKCYLNTYAGK